MNDDQDKPVSYAKRDAWVLGLFGGFFVAFGVLVLIGLFWPQTGMEKVVTVSSGVVLIVVGTAGVIIGKRLKQAHPD